MTAARPARPAAPLGPLEQRPPHAPVAPTVEDGDATGRSRAAGRDCAGRSSDYLVTTTDTFAVAGAYVAEPA